MLLNKPFTRFLKFALSGLLLIFGHHSTAIGQDTTVSDHSRFALHVDAGTIAVLSSASLNFEYSFYRSASEILQLNSRVGFGGAAVFYGPEGLGGFAGITALIGKKNHRFESSGGIFVGKNGNGMGSDGPFALPLLDLGYRYQKPQGGFIFRAKVGILGAGIGLGFAF